MGAKEEQVLALEARRDIYEYIRRAPGVHLRGVERTLGLPFGQVLYHLDHLERHGLIDVKKDGGFKRYFVKNLVGRREKQVIATFRHELPRKIAILLLLEPDLAHREILDHFGVSGSTLSFHLNKMVENGILERRQDGNENYYRLMDERAAAKILILYRESFLDPAVDRFADLWLSANFKDAASRLNAVMADRELVARLRGADSPRRLAMNVLKG